MRKRCESCRQARAKCDLSLPSCKRCRFRHVVCIYPSKDFVWCNENYVVTHRSNHSPGAKGGTATPTSFPSHDTNTSDAAPNGTSQSDLNALVINNFTIARQPQFDSIDKKAVGRFFARWALHPCNNNLGSGYLDFLPDMYMAERPDGALRLALESVANAEVASLDRQGVFAARSRQKYIATLSTIQAGVQQPQALVDDSLLMAILIIDSFELLYMNGYKPLKRYADKVEAMLSIHGVKQLATQRRLFLWRLLHLRLAVRQLLLHEPPVDHCMTWFSMLTTWRPDSHIVRDVLRIIAVNSEAKSLLKVDDHNPQPDIRSIEMMIEKADHLDDDLHKSAHNLGKPQAKFEEPINANTDMPRGLLRSRTFDYYDLWAARTWNYHRLGRIELHQMLIRLRKAFAALSGSSPSPENDLKISWHHQTIKWLCEDILDTMPTLLGLTKVETNQGPDMAFAREVGVLFVMLPMQVIKQCPFAPKQHRDHASEILKYIRQRASGGQIVFCW